jgi:hypothetical protein
MQRKRVREERVFWQLLPIFSTPMTFAFFFFVAANLSAITQMMSMNCLFVCLLTPMRQPTTKPNEKKKKKKKRADVGN